MAFFRKDQPKITQGVTPGGVGYGKPHGIGYTYRGNNLGQGANVWAWETLALPMYTAIGTGIPNLRNFDAAASSGVMYQKQGISIQTLGSPGNLTGSFNSSALLNIDAPASSLPMPAFNAGEFTIPTG